MAKFSRAEWTSGYKYHVRCPYCKSLLEYTDDQLDYRYWAPNGFIYCPKCRHSVRHSEIYAVHEDGSPVYHTKEEADRAIRDGFYLSKGMLPPSQALPPSSPVTPPDPVKTPPLPASDTAFCPNCGKSYIKGQIRFCMECGTKLN